MEVLEKSKQCVVSWACSQLLGGQGKMLVSKALCQLICVYIYINYLEVRGEERKKEKKKGKKEEGGKGRKELRMYINKVKNKQQLPQFVLTLV